jgi:RNA methyltransferase, TrmH family
MVISSSANPRIKAIRALRQRKERERTGLFFVEGIRLVTEAIQSGAPVEALLLAPELLTSQHMHELARAQAKRGVSLSEVTRDVFARVASKDNPQGIGAVVRQRWGSLDQAAFGAALCWIALDATQDPGNIGTILRTSDAVGGAGIILLGNSADPFDPSAVRASMGAVFTQQLVRAGWSDFLTWKRAQGATLVGTSDSATLDYSQATYRAPLVLLMGSEQKGLSREQQAACDLVVRIPMLGRSDSLNLAVATGVVLYAIFEHRRLA